MIMDIKNRPKAGQMKKVEWGRDRTSLSKDRTPEKLQKGK